MKLNFLFGAILIVLTQNCTPQKSETQKINFDIEQLNKYQIDFKNEYKNLPIDEKKEKVMDFIKMYFRNDSLYKKYSYSIKYGSEILKLAKGQYNSVFYNELIYFEKPNDIDSIINYIKANNTIDPYNLKLHRVYRVGSNTIICVNYLDFDIANYENFLMREFNKSLNIEVINPSY